MDQIAPSTDRVYIGIGSNLCDPVAQVRDGITALAALSKTRLVQCSSLYLSPPMGPPEQPDYVNAVAELATELNPYELLDRLQHIEDTHGRRRDGIRWGPRVLDLDILWFGDQQIDEGHLKIPHDGILDRAFVIIPLVEIAPELELPNGLTASSQARRFCDADLKILNDV